jgi:hypothetical protein
MLYLGVFLGIFALVILFFIVKNRQTEAKEKERAVSKWGKIKTETFDFKLVAALHHFLDKKEGNISDQTAVDIDLEEMFEFVDRTNSKPGQQYLYHLLNRPQKTVQPLIELDELVFRFQDPSIRLAAETALLRLSHKNAYYLYELLSPFQSLYTQWLAIYIRFAGVFWMASLAMSIIYKNQWMFVTFLGITFLNFYLHLGNKRKVSSYVHSLPQLHALLQVAEKLRKLVVLPENVLLEKCLRDLERLKRTLRYVNFEDNINRDPSDITSGIWELIKTVLLVEPGMFLVSVNQVNRNRSQIECIFKYVSRIDIAISIQSLRLSLPFYARPQFEHGTEIDVQSLYHPLVEGCVSNSINVSSHQGVLITGSNMSGKTTFIRSVAINALLSQTLFTACAQSYRAPMLEIFTSIRVSDDLHEQKSYFQAEALSVLEILQKSELAEHSLIIIDEIFRGTNTIERVAAAKAILSYFNAKGRFIFVSTHDLELAEFLGTEFSVYSFEEVIAEQRLEFDYKIRPGVLKNKNGIAILAALGYPESIITDARHISQLMADKYKV